MNQQSLSNLAKAWTACALTALATLSAPAQELLYQEDFETDGEAANPKRYTTDGRDVYEIARIRGELNNTDQLGPIYFAHNNEISYVGVPAPTAARRMVMAWNLQISPADASKEAMELFDSAFKWLINNKTKQKIVVNPGSAVDDPSTSAILQRLVDAGHTLVADDTGVSDEQMTTLGDAFIHGGGGSRGGKAAMPMLVINSSDADDVLVSTIGTTLTLEGTTGKIETPAHPAAGGKTGSFPIVAASTSYEAMGDVLAQNVTVLASFTSTTDTPPVTRPFIALINGPNDTPAGTVFGGGPFTGQHGQRFFAGAGMNKWPRPLNNDGNEGDRTLTLRPINVAGKKNLKLTFAAAGSFLDFEQSAGSARFSADYMEIAIDPDGAGPKEFERLVFFTAPSGTDKYVNDATTNPNNPTKLGLSFKDITYNIPDGATDLVIEVRMLSTFWNEIFGIDNIRVTSGDIVVTPPTIAYSRAGSDVTLTWQGSNFNLETSAKLGTGASWSVVTGAASGYKANAASGTAYFRLKSK